LTDPWWRRAVIYQIYPRSFADSDGDGIGDLPGICSRLEYLAELGVNAVWLSPIYRSPMADFGYDPSDHTDVDPVFGTLADLDRLVAEAHAHGLRVLLDWVPNHTSSLHPWFLESQASRSSPKRDWYIWRDGRDGGPPNNWLSAFGGPAWTFDEATGQWYLHLFLPEQPDLNWTNPGVVEAMHGVLRFWLDRGIDGFRADVVHLVGKDEMLPDQPAELADLVETYEHPRTHELLLGVRRVLDEYGDDRVIVGEVPLRAPAQLVPYYGAGDELHVVFDFALMHVPWSAEAVERVVAEAEEAFAAPHLWPCWVLSNHDQARHRTRFGGSEARARAAAVLLLTLRGTPCIYQGEELGLLDADIPPAARVDPAGRDGSRAPIPWKHSESHEAMLALYRELLELRAGSPSLVTGSWTRVASPPGTLVYDRAAGAAVSRIAINFTDAAVGGVAAADGWRVELATASERAWDGTLEPGEAVILFPA
jgi:alpha-glucosidase